MVHPTPHPQHPGPTRQSRRCPPPAPNPLLFAETTTILITATAIPPHCAHRSPPLSSPCFYLSEGESVARPRLQVHTVLDRRPLVTTTKEKHNDKSMDALTAARLSTNIHGVEYYPLRQGEIWCVRTQLILLIVADIFHVVRGGGGPEENTSFHAALASAAVIQCRQFVVASSPRGNHDNRKKPKTKHFAQSRSTAALQSCTSGRTAKLKEPKTAKHSASMSFKPDVVY
ncbi:unnamed protein product [Pleuronectes platessa]|uniref:Uncharacterized protein n=1 Tax=Pleuronectes platessa TaxID=8262 RepID=A0A9N7Z005_PLEPL|nr:unnamed protein product [Pleuronectes platessa]